MKVFKTIESVRFLARSPPAKNVIPHIAWVRGLLMRLLEPNQQTRENTSLLVAENHSSIVQDLLIYIYTNLSFSMSKTQQYL